MGKAVGKLLWPRKVSVLIIGENGAEKTSLLHNLNLGTITERFTDYEATEVLSGDQAQAVTWNLFPSGGSRCINLFPFGGSRRISKYHKNIDAYIYVMNDRGSPDNHIERANDTTLSIRSKYIVAIAVNQRSAGEGTPVTLDEVRSGLYLDNRSHTYEIFPIVATTGEGLDRLLTSIR